MNDVWEAGPGRPKNDKGTFLFVSISAVSEHLLKVVESKLAKEQGELHCLNCHIVMLQ